MARLGFALLVVIKVIAVIQTNGNPVNEHSVSRREIKFITDAEDPGGKTLEEISEPIDGKEPMNGKEFFERLVKNGKNGCPRNRGYCFIQCKHGYKIDESGCSVCECTDLQVSKPVNPKPEKKIPDIGDKKERPIIDGGVDVKKPINPKPAEKINGPSELDYFRTQLSHLLKEEIRFGRNGNKIPDELLQRKHELVEGMRIAARIDGCQPLICRISSCWGGFKRDKYGCETCECRETPRVRGLGSVVINGCPLGTCRIKSCWGDFNFDGRCELCQCGEIPFNAEQLLVGIVGRQPYRKGPRATGPHPFTFGGNIN